MIVRSFLKIRFLNYHLILLGYQGKKSVSKVMSNLVKKGADVHLITMLDELAWLLNLRGSDIEYNPVFTGFGWLEKNRTILFVEESKITVQVKESLIDDGVEIQGYKEFYTFLKTVNKKKIFLDSGTTSYSIFNTLRSENEIIEGTSVISHLKARKNIVEIEGFKKAMLKDGVALIEFLAWLNKQLGKERITEYTAGKKLKEFRSKQPEFMGESFDPIVGYKNHGAIVHLSVGVDDALELQPEGILLFDSGGQYLEGTTDITRTIALGEVAEEQKVNYTLVLKGMISLTNAVFPAGTKGCHLDILARKALWERGLNYGHGTGHGVGHFLNVHEGPMAIRQEYNDNAIEPGMVVSNEPGLYREGKYGIRTENMILCVEKKTTDYGSFYGFETLTVCPIDTTLISIDLLTEGEKNWLNEYHRKVNRILKPALKIELHAFLDKLTSEI